MNIPDYKVPAKGSPFTRRNFDLPSYDADERYLFSLPFIEALECMALILFPPNQPISNQATSPISPVDARVDRYILFRAAWQPDQFGKPLHRSLLGFFLALRDLNPGIPFPELTRLQQEALLEKLEKGELPQCSWPKEPTQKDAFSTIHRSISEGLFAEPGYGGNLDGLGWAYSNFMESK